MSAGAIVFLVVLSVIAVPVVLYLLIEEETANPRIVDRETATREARSRGGRHDSDRDRGPPTEDEGLQYGWLDDDGRARYDRPDDERRRR